MFRLHGMSVPGIDECCQTGIDEGQVNVMETELVDGIVRV